jgi:Domain of unknown function (DUF1996)
MSLRRRVALTSLAVLATAALPLASAARESRAQLHGNNFYSNCGFSHTSMDDPIVYPGEPGRSHDHTFFGNTTTDASSTAAGLRRGKTTCRPRADKAAYWVPTLFRNGREIHAAKAQFYYVVRGYDRMRAFPPGLRVIAGDAHATGPQSTKVTYWACGGRAARTRPSRTVPARCGVIQGHGLMLGRNGKVRRVTWRTKTSLELHVLFPDCWDGKRLDSPDHQSHMAYSRDYRCPATHPVKVPLIRLMIRYPIDRGAGVTLASGAPYTAHADFINAWNQRALERLVASCFHERGCRPY